MKICSICAGMYYCRGIVHFEQNNHFCQSSLLEDIRKRFLSLTSDVTVVYKTGIKSQLLGNLFTSSDF